ncbi:hypothetical protein [Natronococcus sp. A-GB7]|nr:hypothetical protein [Natronococcus sp. A-GB7]MDG5821545.1 hypothetical protein [Natronococcus sp. A-GB7]
MSTKIPDPEAEAKETVEENRELFERIAESDLPIADDIERILEIADGGGD